mgnify:CR=1 FL=1
MQYKILNKTNIEEYLMSIKNIKEYFNGDALFIDEIGNGNLNYVFIIKSLNDNTKALILKQAVPYLRCLGEDFLLGRERMTYEIRALKQFKENTSLHIPFLYDCNESMSTLVMQYLDSHIDLREGLIQKNTYANFSEHISSYLADNLFKTSSLYLSSKEKRNLLDQFNGNEELCKLSEDFVFTFAFMEHESNDILSKNNDDFKALIDDVIFKKEVLALKYKFMTQNDALLHGDFHTGSIMISEKETFVIDPEFSFIGPFGFDIGALFANLWTSYVSHVVQKSPSSYLKYLLQNLSDLLEKFEEKFLTLWEKQEESALLTKGFIDNEEMLSFKKEFVLGIIRDAIGFAGCKIARRMFGASGVNEIRNIKNDLLKKEAMHICLNIAKRFVKENKNLASIQDVFEIIKEEIKPS